MRRIRMKRILSTMLAMVMTLSMASVSAQETGRMAVQTISERSIQVISTTGKIEDISGGQVRILGKGAYNEIILNVQDSTYILDAQDGTKIPFKNLKKGDAITAYYGPMVTRSIPPQGNATALLVGTPKTGSGGMYMKVAKLEKTKEGSIKVLCTNSDRLVTISPAVFAKIADIKEGSELILWYDVMTMSIPAQAIATKVVLLPAKADIQVHIGAGTVVVNGKELALSQNDNRVMLPLRAVAESLGYNVVWDGDKKMVELQKEANTVTLTIGSKEYSKSKKTISLEHAPEMVNGITLAPVEFFTSVLNLKVEMSNNHI
jgi:hypothetical protein